MAKKPSIFDNIAVVYWLDAASHDDGWDELKTQTEIEGLVAIISVGFIISENDREIRIARSAHADESIIEGMFVIPKGMITRVELIPIKKKRVRKPKLNETNIDPVSNGGNPVV